MSLTSRIESSLSLILTHVRANWYRSFITLLSIVLVIVMISQVLITSLSFSFAIIETSEDFENNWQTDILLSFSHNIMNAVLLKKGFPSDLTTIQSQLLSDFKNTAQEVELDLLNTRLDLILVLTGFMALPENQSELYEVTVLGINNRVYEAMSMEPHPMIYSVARESPPENQNQGIPIPSPRIIYSNGQLPHAFATSTLRNGGNITIHSTPLNSKNDTLLEVSVRDVQQYWLNDNETWQNVHEGIELGLPDFNKVLTEYLRIIENFPFLVILVPLSEAFNSLDYYYRTNDQHGLNGSLGQPSPYPLTRVLMNFDVTINVNEYAREGIGSLEIQWNKLRERLPNDLAPTVSKLFFLDVAVPLINIRENGHSLALRLSTASTVFFSMVIYGLLLGLPAIVLGLFAGNFAMNLVKKPLYRQIGIYKTRGMSKRQILFLLATDLLTFSFLAAMVGFVLAHPLALISLTSRGNFEFGMEPLPIVVPTGSLQLIIGMGIALGIFLRALTIKRLAQIKIRETEGAIQDQEPYWKRKNIDFILIIWGGIGLFFYTNLRTIIFLPIPFFLIFILSFLMLPTPILLLVGGIMLLSRTVPMILRGLDHFGKKIDRGVITLSLKDLSRRKHLVRRAVLVIALGTSLALVLLGIPSNFTNYLNDRAYYIVGSEFSITHPLDPSFEQLLQQDLSRHDFEITQWAKLTISSPVTIQESKTQVYRVKILAINSSSFEKAGFFVPEYGLSRLGLSGVLEQLRSNPNETMLISKLSKDILEVEVPGTITLDSTQTSLWDSMGILKIVDDFSYWPNFIDFQDAPIDYNYQRLQDNSMDRQLVIVIDLALYNSIKTKARVLGVSITTIEEGYYIKLNSGNYEEFSRDLRNLGLTFDSIHDHLPSLDDLNFRSIFGANNGIVLYTLAINVFTVLLFAGIYQQERWKDMGVERTLGMSKKQLFGFSVTSTATFAVTSLSIGLILGAIMLQVFMNLFLTFMRASAVPPFRIVYPINEMIPYLTLMFLAILIGSLIAMYLAARRPISNVLKVE